ncbi:hypothetical protein FHX06_001645 [Rhizobium sp. BK512]|nr:hypothetical protein [Rhizobium sp. BK512]
MANVAVRKRLVGKAADDMQMGVLDGLSRALPTFQPTL